jgi:hypothetical protein
MKNFSFLTLVIVISAILLAFSLCTCDDDDDDFCRTDTVDVVCFGCSFNYAMRWKLSTSNAWTEEANSEQTYCSYTWLSTGETTYESCFKISVCLNEGFNSFDIEAQNGYGTWSDAGCIGSVTEGETPYQIVCFP